jgi:hypothetical protein
LPHTTNRVANKLDRNCIWGLLKDPFWQRGHVEYSWWFIWC